MNSTAKVLQHARNRTTSAVDNSTSDLRPWVSALIDALRLKEVRPMAHVIVDVTDELNRSQAADACGVSVDTIKRRLKVNAFPHARQIGLE